MIVSRLDLHKAYSEITKHSELGLDTETTGLMWADRLFSIIIATPEDQYYFNFNHKPDIPGHFILLMDEFMEVFKGVFENRSLRWYIQNAKFDLRMLSKEGIEIKGNVRCTQTGGRILKNNLMSLSLDSLSKKYLGEEKDSEVEKYITKNKLYKKFKIPGKEKEFVEKYFDQVPFEIITKYALTDARLHLKLGQFLDQNIPTNCLKVWENEQLLTKTCLDMEIYGIKLDRDYTQEALSFENRLIREAKDSFRALTGYEYDNKKNTLVKVFTDLGVEIPITEAGNPSFTDKVLESINSPVAKSIQKVRHHEKRVSTYYSSFLYFADSDGYIHADYRQAGTETGRFSCADPNIQQLPKEDEPEDMEAPFLVRKCFVPTEGRMFVAIDYKQQEYKVMADYAGQPDIIDGIKSGMDFHQLTADTVGITRKQAKTLNFACIAEGTEVLTHRGLVPIECIDAKDLLWDGISWVPHGGVVFKGFKEVVKYGRLEATEDHKVFTKRQGAVAFGEASRKQGIDGIVVTEIDGVPIRYSNPISAYPGKGPETPSNFFKVLEVSKRILEGCGKYIKGKVRSLPLRIERISERHTNGYSTYSWEKMVGCAYKMHKPKEPLLEKLRRTRNRGTMQCRGVYRLLMGDVLRGRDSNTTGRQGRQQWALRDREFEASNSEGKSFKQTKKVYDILNSGPRNRFTAGGFLVSNCLYGAGPEKIAGFLGVSYGDAVNLRARYFEKLPYIKHFVRRVQSKGQSAGYIFNWFGRRCHIDDPNFAFILPNHLIQGGCADVVKRAMNVCFDHIKTKKLPVQLVAQIHDELVFEMPAGKLELIPEMQSLMESIYESKHEIKLTTDAKWSEVSLAYKDMNSL